MNDDNVIYLKRRKRKKFSTLPDFLRVALGFAVIIGFLCGAYACEESRAEERHARFSECLNTGMKPINCSFEIAFKE